MVLDGGSARLEQAERFREQVLQEQPPQARCLEPEHVLIRCPRTSPPPPSNTGPPMLEWLEGYDNVTQITALSGWIAAPPSSLPSARLDCHRSRAYRPRRGVGPGSASPAGRHSDPADPPPPPAPASTASSSATPSVSLSGGPPPLPALGLCPRSLSANGRIVGCRASGRAAGYP